MTGKEVASLLRCIREKKGLKWTKGLLCKVNLKGTQYCALGMIARSCGVPIRKLFLQAEPHRWFRKHNLGAVMATNDGSESFEEMCGKFERYYGNTSVGPVEEFIQASKNYAKGLGVKEEDCEG